MRGKHTVPGKNYSVPLLCVQGFVERVLATSIPSKASLIVMANGHSSEDTAVLATYSTRRDAEMARDCLQEAGIRSFISADDAGGMHPQLQRPHGVKLVGMNSAVREAHEVLEDAGMLPQPQEESEPREGVQEAEGLTFSLKGAAGILGIAAVILILLFLAMG